MRTCPFSLAWVDTADGTNQAHYHAECGNKGICNRESGECECFASYSGKGCKRMSCPGSIEGMEQCSGHGTCETMQEIARDYQDRRTGPGHKYQDLSCTSQRINPYDAFDSCSTTPTITSNVVSRQANTDVIHGHFYNLWDAEKIMMCKCDLGYDGPDCGVRIAPKGSDPLSTIKANSMKQIITIGPGTGAPTFANEQFYIKYPDPYGGIWRTDAIDATSDDAMLSSRVREALRHLPNEVLDKVKVAAQVSANPKICHRFHEGHDHLSSFENYHSGHKKQAKYTTNYCKFASTSNLAAHAANMDLLVEFADRPGQSGTQNLLEIQTATRGPGSFPVSAGITTANSVVSVAEINWNENLMHLSESTECSDRGLDDGDGACECFNGFTGLACELMEALA